MLKTQLLCFVVLAFPIIVSSASVAIAVTCNKKDFGPHQACDESWAADTRCRKWPQATCATQTGAPDAGQGAPGFVGCGDVTQNPTKHCITRIKNCLPKYWCLWQAGCRIGTPVLQDGQQVYLTENEGITESCNPDG